MPPKQSKKGKKKTVKRRQAKLNSDNEMRKITTMLSNLQKPTNQVTDLGRMLLHGGNMLGGLVGLPTIFGKGAYKIAQNSLWGPDGQVPFMHSSNESVTFRHREFIADVSMAGAPFTISSTIDINPGLTSSFPYLSSIARNFQEYTFKGLVYEYKTTSSASLATGTNTAMGVVMMAIQYRTDALPFENKQQMLNTMWSVDTIPAANALLPVECDPMENPFQIQYVRDTTPPGDPKMYDLGQLVVATSGGQTGQTNVVGEVWASYEIEFRKPIALPQLLDEALHRTATTWTDAQPLGTVATNDYNSIGATVSGTIILLPLGLSGRYHCSFFWEGGAVATALPNFAFTNLTNTNFRSVLGVGVDPTISIYFQVTVVNPTIPSIITLDGAGTLPTSGAANSRFLILRIPDNNTVVAEW
jgi:hypothetical protein